MKYHGNCPPSEAVLQMQKVTGEGDLPSEPIPEDSCWAPPSYDGYLACETHLVLNEMKLGEVDASLLSMYKLDVDQR